MNHQNLLDKMPTLRTVKTYLLSSLVVNSLNLRICKFNNFKRIKLDVRKQVIKESNSKYMLMFFFTIIKNSCSRKCTFFSIQKIAFILFPYTFNKFLLKRI